MTTLVLDATNKTIVAVMSGAAATTNPSFVASYADNNGTTFTEGANSGSLNGTTPVTLVSAPSSGYRRVIKKLYIENADTAAVTITIYYNNNGTNSNIAKVTLNVGDTWTTDGTFDTYGSLKQTLGTVNLATGVTGTLLTSNGGTGLSSFTAGDLPYYATGTALSKLGIGAANTVLTSSGSAPQWSTSIVLSGSATASAFIPSGASAPTNGVFLPTTNAVGVATNSTERARYDANGNYLLGGTAARGTTAGTNHIDIFNGTAPVGTLTNGISLYSASGDFNFMDSAGNGYKVGFRNVPAVGTKTTSYTLATGDVGKYVQVGTSGSITIPDATFAEGDIVSIFNNTSGNITITCSITTAYISGTDSDKATMTLATRGIATVFFISSTVCVVSGSVT